jgi:hypothetical protein
MVELTNEVVELIQLNYSVERIIKLTSGGYAQIPLRQDGQDGQGSQIRMINPESEEIRYIKGDLSLGEYECQIISGTELPKSKTMFSQLTMQLVNMGLFSGKMGVDEAELILKTNDYPNWRAIVGKLKEMKDKELNAPPPPPPIEKIALGFKDLEFYPDAQIQLLKYYGIEIPTQAPPMPEQVPPEQVPPEQVPPEQPIPSQETSQDQQLQDLISQLSQGQQIPQ